MCARELSARPGRTRGLLQRLCDPWRPSFRVFEPVLEYYAKSTTIRPPTSGSGSDSASATTASRCARESRRQVWIVTVFPARRHVPTMFPSDEQRARPDARRPQLATLAGVRHEERAVLARDARGCRRRRSAGAGRRPQAPEVSRMVGSSRARIQASPDGVTHRDQLGAEIVERPHGLSGADRPPLARTPCGVGRTEDVQVAARQLTGRLFALDLRRRHGPDGGPPCALPADRERAGQRGVAKVVPVRPERPPGVVVPHSLPAEDDVHASGQIVRPSANLRRRPGAGRA